MVSLNEKLWNSIAEDFCIENDEHDYFINCSNINDGKH